MHLSTTSNAYSVITNALISIIDLLSYWHI